jgi:hypothetical protein
MPTSGQILTFDRDGFMLVPRGFAPPASGILCAPVTKKGRAT